LGIKHLHIQSNVGHEFLKSACGPFQDFRLNALDILDDGVFQLMEIPILFSRRTTRIHEFGWGIILNVLQPSLSAYEGVHVELAERGGEGCVAVVNGERAGSLVDLEKIVLSSHCVPTLSRLSCG
jgi:hypothetical protein